MQKYFFSSCHKREIKKKILTLRYQWRLQNLHSDFLPLNHKESLWRLSYVTRV